MKYSLIRNTLKPSRANIQDAGIDIYLPKFDIQFLQYFRSINETQSFEFKGNKLIIKPHKRVRIPSGVIFNTPVNNMLLSLQKTSVPYKTGLVSGGRCVDASYRGEYFASLINTSDEDAILEQDQKIIQVVLVPINQDHILQEVKHSQLFNGREKSTRNTGAFGSSDV